MSSNGADKICFVMSPIGDREPDVRNRADKILKHVIGPAVARRG